MAGSGTSYFTRKASGEPALGSLRFQRLEGRFARAVELGYETIRRGGVAGAVLNGANEATVEAFLNGRLSFGQIVPMVEEILNRTPSVEEVSLEAIRQADAWARQQVVEKIGTPTK